MMSASEYAALLADIRENGQREAIWTHEGQIIDGRNRYQACVELGLPVRSQEWDGKGSLTKFVVSLNLVRRHLNESQRGMVADRLAQLPRGANQWMDTSIDVSITQAEAAMLLNVGEATVQRARQVSEDGIAELSDAVWSGAASVSAAALVAELPQDEQREIVAKGEVEILAAAKQIRQRKAEENAQRNAEKKAQILELPRDKYRCIVIDPPWEMAKIERDERPNQVGLDYPTMSEADLMAFPLPDFAAADCHLYLWTTHKHLPIALRLAEHWGFRYQCLMTWVKNVGMTPFSWMYSTEHVLFCRRGNLPLERLGLRLDVAAKVREHSRKPDEFYERVAEASPGPRIDIFSREPHEGFEAWGNEVDKFAEVVNE